MERVSTLLGEWAATLGLAEEDVVRWRAVGYLHDVLREEDPEALRERVSPDLRELPAPILHGPAAAERLRIEGVDDGELLTAVAWHTVGHPRLGTLGRATYAADFLEPGRTFRAEWRAELLARMPDDVARVVREVVRARVVHLLERGGSVLPVTIGFWNALAGEGP